MFYLPKYSSIFTFLLVSVIGINSAEATTFGFDKTLTLNAPGIEVIWVLPHDDIGVSPQQATNGDKIGITYTKKTPADTYILVRFGRDGNSRFKINTGCVQTNNECTEQGIKDLQIGESVDMGNITATLDLKDKNNYILNIIKP